MSIPILGALVAYLAFGQLRGTTYKTDHLLTPTLNNEHCRVLHNIGSTEDILIDESSAFGYVTNSAEENRFKFHPGLGRFDTELPRLDPKSGKNTGAREFDPSLQDPYRDDVFLFDLKSETFTRMEIEGYDSQDLVLHGFALRTWEKDINTLYFINHQRNGSIVSIFEHRLLDSSPVLHHVRDVEHPNIRIPNSIAPITPERFFITNDHMFRDGYGRRIENWLSPIKSSDVTICEFGLPRSNWALNGVRCKIDIRGLRYANGIEWLPHPGSTIKKPEGIIAVGESRAGVVKFYNYSSSTKTLSYDHTTVVGSRVDNLRRIPGTNDLAVAAFPDYDQIAAYVASSGLLRNDIPIMATVIKESDGWTTSEVVFKDEGGINSLGFMTGVSFVPKVNKLVGGSVSREGLLVCDIDFNTI